MKKSIKNVNWSGLKALVRVDYNVPFVRGTETIADDIRIRESLPTIEYILAAGGSVVLCTHRGRPGGKQDPTLELGPIAERLAILLKRSVEYIHDCAGDVAQQRVSNLEQGGVAMLENVRFWAEEEMNDTVFAERLSQLADVYVNDAFGAAHRAHASTSAIGAFMPAVAGLLMEKELTFLGAVLSEPELPLAAVLGGAKVSDKIAVLDRLIGHAEHLIVGGGMAATFLKAAGCPIGASLLEEAMLKACETLPDRAARAGTTLHLPIDVVVAERIEPGVSTRIVPVDQVEDGDMILDIGPATTTDFIRILQSVKTVVWNGPMGVFEVDPFDQGTRKIATAIANSDAVSVIGGGSTAEAVNALGLTASMSHVSTGGGASLEFLEGKLLPGVAALNDL